MQKTQSSLLAVNAVVLMLFLGGVACIMLMEDQPTPVMSPVRSVLADAVVGLDEPLPVFHTKGGVVRSAGPDESCTATDSCNERSLLVPVLFAFLAGGMINLPEVSSLPCI